nr:helveticin J family class III bacteriocin [Lactobacillus agrestimuris]
MPWNTTEKYQWDTIILDSNQALDDSGYATEFESVQVNNENDIYLTVAYHDAWTSDTKKNKIFRITW